MLWKVLMIGNIKIAVTPIAIGIIKIYERTRSYDSAERFICWTGKIMALFEYMSQKSIFSLSMIKHLHRSKIKKSAVIKEGETVSKK